MRVGIFCFGNVGLGGGWCIDHRRSHTRASRNNDLCVVDRTVSFSRFHPSWGLGGTSSQFLYDMPVFVPRIRDSLS